MSAFDKAAADLAEDRIPKMSFALRNLEPDKATSVGEWGTRQFFTDAEVSAIAAKEASRWKTLLARLAK